MGNPIHYKVLLVEEDPKELELYSDLIHSVAPCEIDMVSRVPEYSDWIDKSNYHLIVISESGSGLMWLEQIKRISPATSVILISKEATVEQAVSAIRLGAEEYLPKPFNVDSFQLAVKRGLDRKVVFGEDSGASHFLHLLNSCQMISGSLEQKKIFEIVQSYLIHELNAGYASIYTLRNGESLNQSESTNRSLREILDIALQASNALVGMSVEQDTYRFIEKTQLIPGLFIFRFRCGGQTDFFCVCLSPENPTPIEAFESRLRLLKAQIEVTGKNIEHYLGVQQLAYLDDATGLYNTRYLNYVLDREITHSQLSKKPFAVLFMDVDKFKTINDKHGHLVGTKLLNELGNHLKKFVRERDSVFRYGGDEFVAVLSACDLVTARNVAERIRESVERNVFLKHENLKIHFTVSIGIALFPDHAKSKKSIIEAADHAMYTAKKATRNGISIAGLSRVVAGVGEKEAVRGRG